MKKSNRFRRKLIIIELATILSLGIIVDIFATLIVDRNMEDDMFKNIRGVCNELEYVLSNDFSQDYNIIGGELYAGDDNISERTDIVERLKKNFGVEATVFFGNVRYLTTIKDESGNYIVGTTQSENTILKSVYNGNTYENDSILINGERYYGMYIPFYNSDGEICGMLFSGLPRTNIWSIEVRILLTILGVSVAVAVIGVLVLALFAGGFTRAFEEIKHFLSRLSRSESTYKISDVVLTRDDEIGDLARYSEEIGAYMGKLIEEDHLTGLYNRRCGEHLLQNMFNNRVLDGEVTVVMCDIDFFKKINDKYGHAMGDEVLIEVSALFKEYMRDNGIAMRWGGEEFVLASNKSINAVIDLIQDIRVAINNIEFHTDLGDFKVSLTFGVTSSAGKSDIFDVVKDADNKLYEGKNSGRNKIIM